MSTTETIQRVTAPEDGVERVTFHARGRNHRLVRVAKQQMPNQFGQVMTVQEGLAYDFRPNGTLVLERGQDVMPTGPRGEDEDALDWIRRHAHLNVYFWEDGREPHRPLPTEEQMLERITRAGMELQPHRLARLIELEEQSHGRAMVINVARATLGMVLRTLEVTPETLPEETAEEREARETLEAVERTQLESELAQQRAGGLSEHEIAAAQAAAQAAALAAEGLTPADDEVR